MEAVNKAATQEVINDLLAHGDSLLRYALGRVGDRSTAEDMVQETLVAAVTKVADFKGQSAALTWLTGILRHKIQDHYRWVGRHPGDQPGEVDATAERESDWFTSTGAWRADPNAGLEVLGDHPERELERVELRAALRMCIENLPESLHHIFVLRELEELDPQETCDIAGISRESLAVLLFRARQSLRACMQRRWLAS